jgi:hypothetical protein
VKRRMCLQAITAAIVLLGLAALAAVALASSASGVTPTVLARGTYAQSKVVRTGKEASSGLAEGSAKLLHMGSSSYGHVA